MLGRDVDLERRLRETREADLANYAEAVALVFATEMAQLDLLQEQHGYDLKTAELAFGYSLGELVALAASGILVGEEALRVPIAMASDCATLARDVTMGVLFSRELPIDENLVDQLCDEITAGGDGVIDVSAVLSPNSMLLLGQGTTIEQFRSRMKDAFPARVHLRVNDSRWPPLHTPIVRQKNVPDRAAVMIQSMQVSDATPEPPVLSLVTGQAVSGGPVAVRKLLRDWVDHRQRLWDAVCGVLHAPVQTVVHIGPEPNVIPATFSPPRRERPAAPVPQRPVGLRRPRPRPNRRPPLALLPPPHQRRPAPRAADQTSCAGGLVAGECAFLKEGH